MRPHPTELPPEDAWNGVTLAINVADREAVDTGTPLPWRPALGSSVRPWTASGAATRGYVADPDGNRWEAAWLPGYR